MRIVVGISGASGSAVALECLRLLKAAAVETHVIISTWGRVTLEHECGLTARDIAEQSTQVHSNKNLAGPLASGSFHVDATVIVPCSVRTLGSIATGTGDTLIARAADVALKERRRLILGLREAPLSTIHLRNALAVSEAGGVVYPLMPAFYTRPDTLDELVTTMAARIVSLAGVRTEALQEWGSEINLGTQ